MLSINLKLGHIDHFSSYLTPLVIKLTEVAKREYKIKLMAKKKFIFLSGQKGNASFLWSKGNFPF
jgi:hypothetical protein